MRPICLLLILAGASHEAVVIDRIAVIVGKHVVKLSDVDRDLRVTEFLNREPFSATADVKRKAADRLVDQQIIRDELVTGGYGRASDADAEAMLREIQKSRFGGSEARFRQALSQYGLTEAQLQAQLLWQLTVLRFIDQRFRPGILVTDEEVQSYRNQHAGTTEAQARSNLEGEQINQQFETWLDSARKRSKVEFRDEALK